MHRARTTGEDTQRGFTLVEMLVSVSIFATVVLVAVGTLIVLINAGSISQTAQTTTSNLSFAIDTMARTFRTGYDYYCTDSIGSSLPEGTHDCTDGASGIVFTNGETGKRMAYRYDDSRGVMEQRIENEDWVDLTSTDLDIEQMEFTVAHTGASPTDTEQPYVRLLLQGRFANSSNADVTPFYIQTLVTSRYLDL
jgi:prepilin-type N-terminal cleavage/methylation domain-containing protein